jgi:hypothetical protein
MEGRFDDALLFCIEISEMGLIEFLKISCERSS